jgi:hypothetical protein
MKTNFPLLFEPGAVKFNKVLCATIQHRKTATDIKCCGMFKHHKLMFDRHINFSSFIFMLPCFPLFLTGHGGIWETYSKCLSKYVSKRQLQKGWGTGKKITLKLVLQMSDVIKWIEFILLRIRFSVGLLEHGFPETVWTIVQFFLFQP